MFLAIALIMVPFGANATGQVAGIEVAQSACLSIGQSVAMERNATLLAATETSLNGAAACEVVLLLPASNGERPRREVVIVAR